VGERFITPELKGDGGRNSLGRTNRATSTGVSTFPKVCVTRLYASWKTDSAKQPLRFAIIDVIPARLAENSATLPVLPAGAD